MLAFCRALYMGVCCRVGAQQMLRAHFKMDYSRITALRAKVRVLHQLVSCCLRSFEAYLFAHSVDRLLGIKSEVINCAKSLCIQETVLVGLSMTKTSHEVPQRL